MKSVFDFLDLPLPIREEIYSLCGLLRECPIDITPRQPLPGPPESLKIQEDSWENPIDRQTLLPGPPYPKLEYDSCFYKERIRGEASFYGNTLDCRSPRIPTELLLVSKRFSEDVTKTLYGKNQFVLRAEKATDFTPLLKMNASSLAAMTSLLVRLNSWPCRYGHEGDISLVVDGTPCFICSTPISEYGSVLDHASTEGRDMANQWNAACKHLAVAMVPRQLSLTFIADVVNVNTGRQVSEHSSCFYPLKYSQSSGMDLSLLMGEAWSRQVALCQLNVGNDCSHTMKSSPR